MSSLLSRRSGIAAPRAARPCVVARVASIPKAGVSGWAADSWRKFPIVQQPKVRAAVQALGPGTKRNFPGEAISELPERVGGERKQRTSSRYLGVTWHKGRASSWYAQLTDPQTKSSRHVGSFACEEDAAKAYARAAVQAYGPGAERNFAGEAVSELPETVGAERKRRRRK
jgi:hypothetical protein